MINKVFEFELNVGMLYDVLYKNNFLKVQQNFVNTFLLELHLLTKSFIVYFFSSSVSCRLFKKILKKVLLFMLISLTV